MSGVLLLLTQSDNSIRACSAPNQNGCQHGLLETFPGKEKSCHKIHFCKDVDLTGWSDIFFNPYKYINTFKYIYIANINVYLCIN